MVHKTKTQHNMFWTPLN